VDENPYHPPQHPGTGPAKVAKRVWGFGCLLAFVLVMMIALVVEVVLRIILP
jgi:hypothetical protein